MPQTKAILR